MVNKIAQALKQLYFFVMQLSMTQKAYFAFVCSVLAYAAFLIISDILKQIYEYLSAIDQSIIIIIAVPSGILLFGLGCYLYILRLRKKEKQLDDDSIDNEELTQDTNIYTSGGNYNESVEGDYIEVQGNYININQDSSEVATEIRELINHLKNQGFTQEDAENQVAYELAEQARKKRKFRNKLFKLRKSLNRGNHKANNISDETEVAKEVVQSATSYSYTSSDYFTEVTKGNYQKLDALLQEKKWKEADLETARLIYAISQNELSDDSPYKKYPINYIESEHIKVIPRKELSTINRLWLKHSKGRFGFSVQKCICKRLLQEFDSKSYFFYTSEIKEKFGNIVGWRQEGNWLYFSDIHYSITAPPGHLPLIVMLDSGKSQRCQIDLSRFQVFVERIY